MNPDFSKSTRLQVVTPQRASFRDLAVYHTRDYLEIVLNKNNGNEDREANITIDNEFGLEDVRDFSFSL
jgi:histone deacetylase 8